MNDREMKTRRALTPDERGVLIKLIRSGHVACADALLLQLETALVGGGIPTFLELEISQDTPASTYPDGPLPLRAFVEERGAVTGEIIIWIKDGYLSALESAWFTDEPPTSAPRPEQVRVEDAGSLGNGVGDAWR